MKVKIILKIQEKFIRRKAQITMGTFDSHQLTGWVTAIFFLLAISNYFVKVINKKFISHLGSEKKTFVDFYKKMMRFLIKNHKLIGSMALAGLILHFYLVYSTHILRLTGVIAAFLIIAIGLLGVYGAFISKNKKGVWLKAHRILPFILFIVIIFHVLFKQF